MKLTKTELRDQQLRLQQLNRYLPTLQLKKAMLQGQASEVRSEIVLLEKEFNKLESQVIASSPLFDLDLGMPFGAIGKVTELKKHYENVAGVELPLFDGMTFHDLNYSLLGTEAYVDRLVELVRSAKEAFVRVTIAIEKKEAIEKELRAVSIRVNLFEKILIPRTTDDIRRIKIFLSDQQLAAVARAKVAKKKIEGHRKEEEAAL